MAILTGVKGNLSVILICISLRAKNILSLIFNGNQLIMLAFACDPFTWEVEAGKSEGQGHARLHIQSVTTVAT